MKTAGGNKFDEGENKQNENNERKEAKELWVRCYSCVGSSLQATLFTSHVAILPNVD